jgi:Tfp pilus assembly protein PilV
VILGVGLLAIATGETISVTNSRVGREISIATAAAEQIVELMRRNKANLSSYDGFDTTDANTRPVAAGMPQNDYDQWKVQIERTGPYGLRGGRGTVALAAGPLSSVQQVTVTVTWTSTPARSVTIQALL